MRFDETSSDAGIEDRRGQGGGGGFGGMGGGRFPIPMGRGGKIGLPAVIAIVLALVFGRGALSGGGSGYNLNDGLDPLRGNGSIDASPAPTSPNGEARDKQYEFVRFVRNNVQDYWARDFGNAGKAYEPAGLVIFDAPTPTGCGTGSPETGPFYCPEDKKVYIDFGFYEQLASRFGIRGDFALAYVVAHEMGHHVQNELGLSAEVQQRSSDHPEDANRLSVKLELQADCLAGVWANSAYESGRLEPGDLDEAINAAGQVGDDRIQEATEGRVQPETFTHGTAEQRQRWFKRGFDGGESNLCDTFASED